MRLAIHGEHFSITPVLEQYVENKLELLNKFGSLLEASECRVTLRVVRKKHFAEITIAANGVLFRAEESRDDMYKAIEVAVDKLDQQIRRYKDKVFHRVRQGKAYLNGMLEEKTATLMTKDADDEQQMNIVRIKRFDFKPMDVEEAIMQMELLDHTFFVFSNLETSQINVVYRRNDGGFGLIGPS